MSVKATNTILYGCASFAIGLFECPVNAIDFNNTGPASGYLVVFPRLPVQITHAGKRPVIADQNTIMFYNQGQEYLRERIVQYGDRSLFICFQESLARQLLEDICPLSMGSKRQVIRFVSSLCSPEYYLTQSRLAYRLASSATTSPLEIESLTLELLHGCFSDACGQWRNRHCNPARRVHSRHVEIAEETKRLLALGLDKKLSLVQLAVDLATSPYHLCRVFHRIAGISLNKYINRLRLHTSLQAILEGQTTMTNLALELGYATPSHFSMAFKKLFSISPSDFKGSFASPVD